jgi:acetyltransferase
LAFASVHHPAMSATTAPVHWLLPDGREATLRAIAPQDFALESAFLDTLSMEAGYNRLFSTRHPSPDEIRRWTDVDPAREVAFIVTVEDAQGETMLAVGRAVHDGDGPDAEFALLVGDAAKRQGIGRRLTEVLVEAMRERGVRTLHGATLSTNASMLALGQRLGFAARRESGDATLTRLSLSLS